MALDISPLQSAPSLFLEGSRPTLPHEAAVAEAPLPTPVDLKAALRDLERVSAAFNRRLAFSVNEKLGRVVVKVLDANTDKVVREIPPEELQHVYERIREVIGILFDEEA